MSMIRDERVICPRCGKENYHIIWVSVCSFLDPDAARMLEEGTLNDFVCCNCGKRIPAEDVELYLWMQKQRWYLVLQLLRHPQLAKEYMARARRYEQRRQRYEVWRQRREEKGK